MIFPRRCAIMTFPTACEKRNVPVRLVSITLFHCSSVIASTGAPQEVARIVDQDVDASKLFDSGVGNLLNAGGLLDVTAECENLHAKFLQFFGSLLAPLFLARAQNEIRPISARPSAICRPSPTEPPVTIATRPARSNICLVFISLPDTPSALTEQFH